MTNYPDEGYIKFEIYWEKIRPFPVAVLQQLIDCRNQMFREKLIGFDPEEKVGYGNISNRIAGTNSFFISATQTGHIPEADKKHFVKVTETHPEKNQLKCEGPAKASSESMTHAAIYSALPGCNAVIHVHHSGLWSMKHFPITSESIRYGTPEMAAAVAQTVRVMNKKNQNILVMKGHQDGVIAYGPTLKETVDILLSELYKISSIGS